jgi:hypothetical protein
MPQPALAPREYGTPPYSRSVIHHQEVHDARVRIDAQPGPNVGVGRPGPRAWRADCVPLAPVRSTPDSPDRIGGPRRLVLRHAHALRESLDRLGASDETNVVRRIDAPLIAPRSQVPHVRRHRKPKPAYEDLLSRRRPETEMGNRRDQPRANPHERPPEDIRARLPRAFHRPLHQVRCGQRVHQRENRPEERPMPRRHKYAGKEYGPERHVRKPPETPPQRRNRTPRTLPHVPSSSPILAVAGVSRPAILQE